MIHDIPYSFQKNTPKEDNLMQLEQVKDELINKLKICGVGSGLSVPAKLDAFMSQRMNFKKGLMAYNIEYVVKQGYFIYTEVGSNRGIRIDFKVGNHRGAYSLNFTYNDVSITEEVF